MPACLEQLTSRSGEDNKHAADKHAADKQAADKQAANNSKAPGR
jgi:hypothetical protein